MKIIVDDKTMQQCDKNTIEHYKIPSIVLMEQASMAVAHEICELFKKDSRILIACGSGNNGGDGIATGRILYLLGYNVTLFYVSDMSKCSSECKIQSDIVAQYDIPVKHDINKMSDEYDVIVDAVFGVGLSREITGKYKDAIEFLNKLSGYKIALDIASGISSSNGQILGCCFEAKLTLAIAFAKIGQYLFPGAQYSGEIKVLNININEKSFLDMKPNVFLLQKEDLKNLPVRNEDSNKGSFGKILVISGQKNMAGAAYFSSKAAYLTGCGLVKIFTVEENRTVLQTLIPEAILDTYIAEKFDENALEQSIEWADTIICGPGIGTDTSSIRIVDLVLKHNDKKCILDADALNIISSDISKTEQLNGNFILTPHLKEMSRLCNRSISDIKKDIINIAKQYALKWKCTIVLKDSRTIVASTEDSVYLIDSGCSGMATAGAGDVLSGIVGALFSETDNALKAAAYAAYIHGLSGSYIQESISNRSIIADDILNGLRKVLKWAN